MTAPTTEPRLDELSPSEWLDVQGVRWSRASPLLRVFRHGDVLAVSFFVFMATLFALAVVRPLFSFTRGDWPTFAFPVYSYLGERLRSFDIPGWNPHQFSGAPFLGDPESGWMYVPAMVIYTLLPPEPATIAYIGFHIFLASVSAYALARVLGLDIVGGLIAGASYALAWVAPTSMQLVIFVPVGIWLTVAFIGCEFAARATTWSSRAWSWLFAGLAISQILAIWLGQGSYYAFIAIGGWIVYRTLVAPRRSAPIRQRLSNLAVTCVGVFGVAFGLSAVSVLPRIDMVSRSILAGGVYNVASAWEETKTGFPPRFLLHEVVGGYSGSQWWYVGAVAAALALLAPLVAYRWRPMGYFTFLAIFSLLLTLDRRTPVQDVLYRLLPRFEELHEHSPDRVLILLGPAVALLAGATASYLWRWHQSRAALLAVALVPGVLALLFMSTSAQPGAVLSRESFIIIVATSALVACFSLAASLQVRQLALLGLLCLVVWDPAGRLLFLGFVDESRLERSLHGSLAGDPKPFLYKNAAAQFIAEHSSAERVRYAGFDPSLLPDPSTIDSISPDVGYRSNLREPFVHWLLVFNWATWFGIDDVQGYNPLQDRRYAAYFDALNGHRQEYHERDVFPAGITSPLLDMLNLRYVVVPSTPSKVSELPPTLAGLEEVFADDQVRILENPDALPRVWLVHEARSVDPDQALSLLVSGQVNPRLTALVETQPPPLEPAQNPSLESAAIVAYEPDRIDLRVAATSPALLMLSEVWDPGWSATVDGVDAPVLVADSILRAVPVPSGEVRVVLRYEPPLLRIGAAVTVATLLLTVALAVWLASRANKRNGEPRGNAV